MRGGGTPEGGSMKFCTFVESLDVIKCANFHVYLMIITCQRGSARQCCKGHVSFLWEKPIFDPSQKPNPLSYNHKNLHD
jgi:hypothetical protein